MCSNRDVRLTLIGDAIDRLAAEMTEAAESDPGLAASRIAAIWQMMADADPGLARRLRDYTEPGRDG